MKKIRKLFFSVPEFDVTFTCYAASWVFRWFWIMKWVKITGYNVHIAINEKEAKEYIKMKKNEYIKAVKHCKL